MKSALSKALLSLAVCAAPFAQAQSCGSGGATVCLTASGDGNGVQLNWTASTIFSAAR